MGERGIRVLGLKFGRVWMHTNYRSEKLPPTLAFPLSTPVRKMCLFGELTSTVVNL